MVTNDERRRVAAALRKYGEKKYPNFNYAYLYSALGLDVVEMLESDSRDAEIYNLLADLIDPDGGHDAEAGKSSEPTEQGDESFIEWLRCFGSVDSDVLLKLVGDMADDADSCSRSARLAADEGDRKMTVLLASIADDYIEKAERIRSALGVGRGDKQKA